jgi:hypothetical protein
METLSVDYWAVVTFVPAAGAVDRPASILFGGQSLTSDMGVVRFPNQTADITMPGGTESITE